MELKDKFDKYLNERKDIKDIKSDASKLYTSATNLIRKVNSLEGRDKLSTKTTKDLTKLLELIVKIEDNIKREIK